MLVAKAQVMGSLSCAKHKVGKKLISSSKLADNIFRFDLIISFAICLSIAHRQNGFNIAEKNIWKRLRVEREFNDFYGRRS